MSETIETVSVESDEDRVQPVSKFGLLNIEDESGSGSEQDSDAASSTAKQPKKKQTSAAMVDNKTANKAAAKKGKDAKKAKDEDDIDELLAELDAPKTAEKKERKKAKGGGSVDDVVGPVDATSTQAAPATVEQEIDYRNMTQDEIARLMEEQYGEDSEEERKKAKGKKKMQKARNGTKQTENGEMGEVSGKDADRPTDGDVVKLETDADNVSKSTKKQSKKTQRKQMEVLCGIFCVFNHKKCVY